MRPSYCRAAVPEHGLPRLIERPALDPRSPQGSLCPTEATYEALPCDAGAYCPEGSAVSILCNGGTYSSATNLASASECTTCSAGYACRAVLSRGT
jgi:hypothetical protein